MWVKIKEWEIGSGLKRQVPAGQYPIENKPRRFRYIVEPHYVKNRVDIEVINQRGKHTITEFAWVKNWSDGPVIIVVEEFKNDTDISGRDEL